MIYYLLYDPNDEDQAYIHISSADGFTVSETSTDGWVPTALEALSSPLSAERAAAGGWADLAGVFNQFECICQSPTPSLSLPILNSSSRITYVLPTPRL